VELIKIIEIHRNRRGWGSKAILHIRVPAHKERWNDSEKITTFQPQVNDLFTQGGQWVLTALGSKVLRNRMSSLSQDVTAEYMSISEREYLLSHEDLELPLNQGIR
jgi:hypothetical protein